MWWQFKPYVNVARRHANAAREIKQLQKNGRKVLPVKIEGRTIARSFWGKAWCENLESYSDYSNRLPRGRTYVRNGSVCDLQIEAGKVTALVSGSELYEIDISIAPAKTDCWTALKRDCAGQIGAVIELLRGRMSDAVMRIITRPDSGLFPKPSEIKLECSCPDWAGMCKHVAAVMYGIGARLDQQPELLFVLRQVDHLELITDAANIQAPTNGQNKRKTIDAGDLSDVFGIEISSSSTDSSADPKPADPQPEVKTARRSQRRPTRDHGRAHGKKAGRVAKPQKTKRTGAVKPPTVARRRKQLKPVS